MDTTLRLTLYARLITGKVKAIQTTKAALE